MLGKKHILISVHLNTSPDAKDHLEYVDIIIPKTRKRDCYYGSKIAFGCVCQGVTMCNCLFS